MSSNQARIPRELIPMLSTMDLDSVNAPGAYILHTEGLLLRVPPQAIVENGASWSITASKPIRVSRISDNPWIAIGSARELAKEHHLPANF